MRISLVCDRRWLGAPGHRDQRRGTAPGSEHPRGSWPASRKPFHSSGCALVADRGCTGVDLAGPPPPLRPRSVLARRGENGLTLLDRAIGWRLGHIAHDRHASSKLPRTHHRASVHQPCASLPAAICLGDDHGAADPRARGLRLPTSAPCCPVDAHMTISAPQRTRRSPRTFIPRSLNSPSGLWSLEASSHNLHGPCLLCCFAGRGRAASSPPGADDGVAFVRTSAGRGSARINPASARRNSFVDDSGIARGRARMKSSRRHLQGGENFDRARVG